MRKSIFYSFFILVPFFFGSSVCGQEVNSPAALGLLTPVKGGTVGRLVKPQSSFELKGPPYLYDDWTEGVLFASNGQEYSKIQLKFDLLTEELLFQDKRKGYAYAVDMPVDSFMLVSEYNEHYFIRKGDGKFYERLFNGSDVKLYKRISKNLVERKLYASADVTSLILERTYYYVEKDGKMERMQANRRSVLGLLNEKDKETLEEFLKQDNIHPGSELGLVRAVEFLDKNADPEGI